LKTITKKVIVEHPEKLGEYLSNEEFQVIRFGSAFCLRYAEEKWNEKAIQSALEEILAAGKTPEFQTFLAPSSNEHINYTKTCMKILEDFSKPVKLAVGDIGFLSIPYAGEKTAHYLKITNELDLALLIDLGIKEIGVDSDTPGEFISKAQSLGMKVELTVGNAPIFSGWRCYSGGLYSGETCGMTCQSTKIPLFCISEKEPVFYASGKNIYSVKEKTADGVSPDSTLFYP